MVEALGGGIWTAVVGDWDRLKTDFKIRHLKTLTVRSEKTGDERSMVVDRIVIHPNFTDYKDDLGKCTVH